MIIIVYEKDLLMSKLNFKQTLSVFGTEIHNDDRSQMITPPGLMAFAAAPALF